MCVSDIFCLYPYHHPIGVWDDTGEASQCISAQHFLTSHPPLCTDGKAPEPLISKPSEARSRGSDSGTTTSKLQLFFSLVKMLAVCNYIQPAVDIDRV